MQYADVFASRIHDAVFPTFQAIVDVAGNLFYHEACVRTFSSQARDVHSRLLSVAEEVGFVDLIDLAIADRALTQAQTAGVPVGLNVSVFTIERSGEEYLRLLGAARRVPNGVVVEVTETVESHSFDLVMDFVRDARRLGALIALDDFGTGSFTQDDINALRPDILKFAMPRVHEAVLTPVGRRWLGEAVSMAKSVRAYTVAEGIESAAQAGVIQKLGVDYYQGFHFARPIHLLPAKNVDRGAYQTLPDNVTPLYASIAL